MQDKKRYRSRYDPPPTRRRASSEITGWVERWDLTLPLPEDARLTPAYDDRVVAAFKACRDGTASSEQQQIVMSYAVWAFGTYHDTVRANPHDEAILQGRRQAGLLIVKLFNTKTRTQDDSEHGR
jgi:hypothetical protein